MMFPGGLLSNELQKSDRQAVEGQDYNKAAQKRMLAAPMRRTFIA
jgi:hypothetical protein